MLKYYIFGNKKKHFGGDGKQYQYQQNKQPPFTEIMENQVLASHKYTIW